MPIPDSLLHDLEHQGWTVSDDIIPAELAHHLLAEGQQRWEAGQFHEARVGDAQAPQRDTRIRGDAIQWLADHDPAPACAQFLHWSTELQTALNRHFFLGLKRLECHFARYGSGAGYATHVDQHQGTSHRKISMVLYLNPDWQAGDGGELCIYDPDAPATEIARVAPAMGRIALFRSDTIPHAVLPCTRTRWSLTGWFRNDDIL